MKSILNKNKVLILILLPTLLILLICTDRLFTLENLKSQIAFIRQVQVEFPYLIIVVYSLIYVLISALALPGAAPFTLLAGALFGLFYGTLLVSFASTFGSTLAFLASRYLFKESVNARFGDRIEKINLKVRKSGISYLFFLRLNPVIPFFMINSLMGLTPMPVWTFYWVSQIGMLPGTLLFVNAGAHLGQIKSISSVFTPTILLSFFALGLVPFLLQKLFNKISAKNDSDGFNF